MENIPTEIITRVYSKLSAVEKVNFSSTCRYLRDIYVSSCLEEVIIAENDFDKNSYTFISAYSPRSFLIELPNYNAIDEGDLTKQLISFAPLLRFTKSITIFGVDFIWMDRLLQFLDSRLNINSAMKFLSSIYLIHIGDSYFGKLNTNMLKVLMEYPEIYSRLANLWIDSGNLHWLRRNQQILISVSKLHLNFSEYQVLGNEIPNFRTASLEELRVTGSVINILNFFSSLSHQVQNRTNDLLRIRRFEMEIDHCEDYFILFQNIFKIVLHMDSLRLISLKFLCKDPTCSFCFEELISVLPVGDKLEECWLYIPCSFISPELNSFISKNRNIRKLALCTPQVKSKCEKIKAIDLYLNLGNNLEKLEISDFFVSTENQFSYFNITNLLDMKNLEGLDTDLFEIKGSFFQEMLTTLVKNACNPRSFRIGQLADYWTLSPHKLLNLHHDFHESMYEEDFSLVSDGYSDYNLFLCYSLSSFLRYLFQKYPNLTMANLGGIKFIRGTNFYDKRSFYTSNDCLNQHWMSLDVIEEYPYYIYECLNE